MPIAAATLARIQELKAESLATLMASIEPVEAAARIAPRAGDNAQGSLQSAEAAIRAVIVTPPESGIAKVTIAGALVEVMLPPEVLRAGAANPALLREGAVLMLPADVPARPLPGPATLVNVHPQPAGQPVAPSVGPALPLASAYPPGTLGAVIARLAGIAFPQGEAPGQPLPPPVGTSPSLRPGMLTKPVQPEIAEAMLKGASRHLPLGAALETILAGLATPEGEATPLPAPVLAAMRALAGLRATPEAASSPEGLRRAIRDSGLFLEAGLAQMPPAPVTGGVPLAPPQDLKALLFQLRALIGASDLPSFHDDATPPTPATARPDQAAEPRPAAPRAQAETPPRPGEIARAVEGAIERVKLNQIASLPDHPEIRLSDERAQPMRLALSIPLATQGPDRPATAVLGLVIEHNPLMPEPPAYAIEDEGHAAPAEGFPWKIRVALDLEETGPVQAEIALRGQSVAVTLWAERKAMAGRARDGIGSLHAALTDAAFDVVHLEVKDGLPHGRLPRATPMLDRRT